MYNKAKTLLESTLLVLVNIIYLSEQFFWAPEISVFRNQRHFFSLDFGPSTSFTAIDL